MHCTAKRTHCSRNIITPPDWVPYLTPNKSVATRAATDVGDKRASAFFITRAMTEAHHISALSVFSCSCSVEAKKEKHSYPLNFAVSLTTAPRCHNLRNTESALKCRIDSRIWPPDGEQASYRTAACDSLRPYDIALEA